MKWLAHLSVRRTRRHTRVNEHVSSVALYNTNIFCIFIVVASLFTLFLKFVWSRHNSSSNWKLFFKVYLGIFLKLQKSLFI